MVVRTICLLIATVYAIAGCKPIAAQLYQPVVDTLLLPLGNHTVQVHQSRYGDAPAPFFVLLHHNEQTANEAAQQLLQQRGGVYLALQNGRQRLVRFRLDGKAHQFDPNRMFTPLGAEQSLKLLGDYTPAALEAVLQLSDTLLSLLPDSLPLIAVHNNTENAYSLLSYFPGGAFANEAADVFRNAEMDPDDFVLTTDSALFYQLKEQRINVVLQHNDGAQDDGSLGFLWGKMGRSYTNVEAQYGHGPQQTRMIEAVLEGLDRILPNKY